jgi:hypothetical protein
MFRHTDIAVSRSVQSILLLALAAVFLTLPAAAQKAQAAAASAPHPKYDLHAESKVKGTIDEVKLPSKGSENEIAHLQVKDGANSVDVYLCPKSFYDDMGMNFTKGDGITITGSKVKDGEADIFLAREIVKGSSDTYLLRDEKGEPVWSWKH